MDAVGERAVLNNMGLVYMTVNRSTRYLDDLVEKGDLESWGTVGLMHAVKNFDPSKGFKFSSYAGRCIFGSILNGLRSIYPERWRANKTNTPNVTVRLGSGRVHDEELLELLGAHDHEYHAHVMERNVQFKAVLTVLDRILTPKQRRVVALMLENDMHQVTVAAHLGCSRQNVEQIWSGVLKRAKAYYNQD